MHNSTRSNKGTVTKNKHTWNDRLDSSRLQLSWFHMPVPCAAPFCHSKGEKLSKLDPLASNPNFVNACLAHTQISTYFHGLICCPCMYCFDCARTRVGMTHRTGDWLVKRTHIVKHAFDIVCSVRLLSSPFLQPPPLVPLHYLLRVHSVLEDIVTA